MGSNAANSLGGGTGIDYNRYGCCPLPYGTGYPPATPYYFAFDQGKGEQMQVLAPVLPAPGKHNFTDIFGSALLGMKYEVFFEDVYMLLSSRS